MKEGRKKNRTESRMTKGSPDYKKRLVSIKGARVALFNNEGDLVTLGSKAKNVTEKDLANNVNCVTSVKNLMNIE